MQSHEADLNCGACGSQRHPVNVIVHWWRRESPLYICSSYVFLKGLLPDKHVLMSPESTVLVTHCPCKSGPIRFVSRTW